MRRALICALVIVIALAVSGSGAFRPAGLRSFEIVPLETVSETSSNASIGDLNGDGFPDIVLVKGRHWQVASRIFSAMAQEISRQGQGCLAKQPRATRVLWLI